MLETEKTPLCDVRTVTSFNLIPDTRWRHQRGREAAGDPQGGGRVRSHDDSAVPVQSDQLHRPHGGGGAAELGFRRLNPPSIFRFSFALYTFTF